MIINKLDSCQGRKRNIFLRRQSYFFWFFSWREMLFPGRKFPFWCHDHETQIVQFLYLGIRNLAYFDSHTVLIKVCNTAHNFDCRRKKPPKFLPLKLEICLNYAYSLDLCCYNCVNTNLFQRCVHVWLNNEVEIFGWNPAKFLWLPPVKIGRIHMMLLWMSRSALAQLK